MRKLIALSLLITLVLVACASLSYPVESALYDTNDQACQTAYDSLLRAKSAGQLTHDQDVAVGLIVADVKAADSLVFDDLEAWRSTGKMPATYLENVRQLRHAQGELIFLAGEVR